MAAEKPPATVPDGLGDRGTALWSALAQVAGTPSGDLALEACRTADRLDELDAIIAGKGVLPLLMFRTRIDMDELLAGSGDEHRVTVKIEVSNVLAEARQQGQALKNLLNELGVSKAGVTKSPAPAPANGLDELSRRRRGER